MKGNKRLAIIGLGTLASRGIKSIVRDCEDLLADTFINFSDFMPLAENYDSYVADSLIFAGNLDFFMPRRQKTVVVGNFVNSDNDNGSGPFVISYHTDEAVIEAYFKKMAGDRDDESMPTGELSQREQEVLRLIATGKLNKEIADQLCISVNTVITHRKNISAKLGIKSASGLSLYAVMNGYI